MIIKSFQDLPSNYCLLCNNPLIDSKPPNQVYKYCEKEHYGFNPKYCEVYLPNDININYYNFSNSGNNMIIYLNSKSMALPFVELDYSDLNAVEKILTTLVNFL